MDAVNDAGKKAIVRDDMSNSGMMVPAQDANGLDSYLSLTNECVRRPYLFPTTARPAALALCNSRLEVSSYDQCLSSPGVAADWWPVIGCNYMVRPKLVGLTAPFSITSHENLQKS